MALVRGRCLHDSALGKESYMIDYDSNFCHNSFQFKESHQFSPEYSQLHEALIRMNTRQIQKQMEKQVHSDDITHQNMLIDERDREIQKINEEMTAINTIFTQLATLVDEQSDYVQGIRDNITSTSKTVNSGVDDLKEAEKLQEQFPCRII